MTWQLSPAVHLRNDRVSDEDADRQTRTAVEILRRLNDQPGLVLADEVGMGKTYVALAVAVSVLEATRRKRPVVVMVPAAVAEKWPTEWAVFSQRCLRSGHGIRASGAIRRAACCHTGCARNSSARRCTCGSRVASGMPGCRSSPVTRIPRLRLGACSSDSTALSAP